VKRLQKHLPLRVCLALASALLLSLSSCSLLFMGQFSSDIGQITARADLSAGIAAEDASSFNLSIVQSGDSEYVLLFSTVPFSGARNHLYVLSPNLTVLNTYSLDDITALNPPGGSFSGSVAMTRLVDGRIIIGNVAASPSTAGLTLLGKLQQPLIPITASLENWAIEGPTTANWTWTNFVVMSGNLAYTALAADFSAAIPRSCPLGPTGGSYSLQGVFTNPIDIQSNVALLVFGDDSSNNSTSYFIQVPKDPDLVNAFSGIPLIGNPAYASTSFTKNNLDSDSIAVTSDGIVAFDGNTRSWIWFTPSAPDAVKSLPVGNRSSAQKSAFSFSNAFYCIWDPTTRVLTRYEKWW
jgi:hypothetical protein